MVAINCPNGKFDGSFSGAVDLSGEDGEHGRDTNPRGKGGGGGGAPGGDGGYLFVRASEIFEPVKQDLGGGIGGRPGRGSNFNPSGGRKGDGGVVGNDGGTGYVIFQEV